MAQVGDFVKYNDSNNNYKYGTVLGTQDGEYILNCSKTGNIICLQKKFADSVKCVSRKSAPSRSERRRQSKRGVQKKKIGAVTTKTRAPRSLSIYMLDLGQDYYKVGFSKNVGNRIKSLKVGSLQKIVLIDEWKVAPSKARLAEKTIKERFAKQFVQSDGGTEVFYISNFKKALGIVKDVISSV